MNERGQIDLRTPVVVLIGACAFLMVCIVALITIGILNDAEIFGVTSTVSHTITNESGAYINTTGYRLSGWNTTWTTITITAIWVNVTDNVPYMLTSGNNTVTTSTGTVYNQSIPINATQWNAANISYTYIESYAAPSEQLTLGNITSNVTTGVNTVSAKLPTVFLIAAIIFVLTAIGVLFVVWQKFRGGTIGG